MAIPPVQNTIKTTANNILTNFHGEDAPKISIELFQKKLGKTSMTSIPTLDLPKDFKTDDVFERASYTICETTQNEIVLYTLFAFKPANAIYFSMPEEEPIIQIISPQRWTLYCEKSGFELFSKYLDQGNCNNAGFLRHGVKRGDHWIEQTSDPNDIKFIHKILLTAAQIKFILKTLEKKSR